MAVAKTTGNEKPDSKKYTLPEKKPEKQVIIHFHNKIKDDREFNITPYDDPSCELAGKPAKVHKNVK